MNTEMPVTSTCPDSKSALNVSIIVSAAIIFFTGLIGNITVLLIIIKKRKYGTSDLVYRLIGNLALYDILLLLFSWPIELTASLTPMLSGQPLCYFCSSFPILLNTGTAVTMVMIALDRYWVLLKNVNPNSKERRKCLILVFILLVALGYSSPVITYTVFAHRTIQLMKIRNRTCKTSSICFLHFDSNNQPFFSIELAQIYFVTRYVMIYVLPLIVVVTIYSKIMRNLQSRIIIKKSITYTTFAKAQKKLIRKLLILVIVFFVMSSPGRIYYLIVHFNPRLYHDSCYLKYQSQFLICQLIGISRCSLNPLLYASAIPGFELALRNLLYHCCSRLNQVIKIKNFV
ncbi:Substance-K receptor [Trichoplax sp. H2]|nr:Substance-K receptor [Trichoplax sp. H2]|eukprot:RDD37913.1 Substance-K receptor [Trichoplax sp. H2]